LQGPELKRWHGRFLCGGNFSQEAIMKFIFMAVTVLAIAAVTPASANLNQKRDTVDTATTQAKPSDLMLAGRRKKCQENLGYGRRGSYGCG
jgi:hypothetical protein